MTVRATLALAVAGRPVAVVRGTANEAVIREYDRRAALRLDVLVADTYREAIDLVHAGKADALAADDVSRSFRALAASRQIEWLYNRWFVRPLPSGPRLDMPMSRELRIELELLGLPRD